MILQIGKDSSDKWWVTARKDDGGHIACANVLALKPGVGIERCWNVNPSLGFPLDDRGRVMVRGGEGPEAAAITPGIERPMVFSEAVDHPEHYGGADNPCASIEFPRDWVSDEMAAHFWRVNALTFLRNAGKKDPARELEDLEKARWYLDREIQLRRSL